MKYTKDNLSNGLTPEYVSACKSLDMWLRKKYGGSYIKGAISESRRTIWFDAPAMFGNRSSCGYSWASIHINGTFGVVFSFWKPPKTCAVEAKIPCDKLQWEIREIE